MTDTNLARDLLQALNDKNNEQVDICVNHDDVKRWINIHVQYGSIKRLQFTFPWHHYTTCAGYACGNSDLATVKKLVEAGADLFATDSTGNTQLHRACRSATDAQQKVELLLKCNQSLVDRRNNNENTPLHSAARVGNSDVVAILIDHGAKLNAQGQFKRTALHIASRHGHFEFVKVLTSYNYCNTRAKDKYGQVAARCAVANKHTNIAEYLTNISKIQGNVIASTQNLRGSIHNVSGSTQNLRGSTHNVSGSTQNVSGSTQNVSGSTQNVSGSTQDLSTGEDSSPDYSDDFESESEDGAESYPDDFDSEPEEELTKSSSDEQQSRQDDDDDDDDEAKSLTPASIPSTAHSNVLRHASHTVSHELCNFTGDWLMPLESTTQQRAAATYKKRRCKTAPHRRPKESVVGSADDVYGLSHHNPRGYAVIVNVKKGRPGSEYDVAMMTQLFKQMHYEVILYEDPTKEVGVFLTEIHHRHTTLNCL